MKREYSPPEAEIVSFDTSSFCSLSNMGEGWEEEEDEEW